jgi:hypothetical protein
MTQAVEKYKRHESTLPSLLIERQPQDKHHEFIMNGKPCDDYCWWLLLQLLFIISHERWDFSCHQFLKRFVVEEFHRSSLWSSLLNKGHNYSLVFGRQGKRCLSLNLGNRTTDWCHRLLTVMLDLASSDTPQTSDRFLWEQQVIEQSVYCRCMSYPPWLRL